MIVKQTIEIKMIVKFVYHYIDIVLQDLVVILIDNRCIFDDREGTIPHQFVRLPLPQRSLSNPSVVSFRG